MRRNLLDIYLLNGGFPETIKAKSPNKYIRSLFDAIINKDICQRYKIRYVKTLMQIASGLLDKFCQEISYSNLQNEYQLKTVHTAKNYVSYLENAYLIRLVPCFSFKSIERQTKRKVYAIDPSFINEHDSVLKRENSGWRLENVVALELLRRLDYSSDELYYIRKSRGYEVDFAVARWGRIIKLIQLPMIFPILR